MYDHDDFYYLDLVLSGDTEAFRPLVDRYKNKVFRLAFQILRHHEDAEEITQDCFVKAYLSLAKFNKKSGFGTWIYRITYNACIDHKRKQKIIALPISGNNREIDQRFFVESRRSLEEKEIKQALKLLLEKLREDEQTMIQLHYMHGKNMAEIAEVMGISHGNVRKKMERTRFRLKEMFQNMFKNELSELL